MSRAFAIASLEEARAYLAHGVLGPRVTESAAALLSLGDTTAEQIFGLTDAMKLRSSMTLFLRAAPGEPVFAAVLERYFAGRPDPATDGLLSAAAPDFSPGAAVALDGLAGEDPEV